MRSPRARLGWTIPLALTLAACTTTTRQTLLDLECGPQRLRFQDETAHNDAATQWTVSLLRRSGWSWEVLSQARPAHDRGPAALSRFLDPALGFHAFPFDAQRPRDERRPLWTLFLDPARVTRADYETIAACLATNASAVDRALGGARPAVKDVPTDSPERYLQVAGSVYGTFDLGYEQCGGKTLGARWDCADHRGSVKTLLGGALLLCREPAASAPLPGAGSMPPGLSIGPHRFDMGALSPDQSAAVLRTPTADELRTFFEGRDPKAYYATCRDSAGRGFPETLTLQ